MGLVYHGLPTFPETNIAIAVAPENCFFFFVPQKEKERLPAFFRGFWLLLLVF